MKQAVISHSAARQSEAVGVGAVVITLWATGGLLLVVIHPLLVMAPIAMEAMQGDQMTWGHWLVLVAWTLFQFYTEGYRGFHQAFAPQVAARARHIAHHPRWHWVVLAPLFAAGLFHASRRRLITSYGLVVGITLLVLTVRLLPQPWRGIIDAGVVAGLSCGVLSMVWFALRALAGAALPAGPALPDRSRVLGKRQ